MYHVEFTPNAEADLTKLEASVAQRVLNRLRWLAENFESIRIEALTGRFSGVFKLRVGDYRVLYICDRREQKIIVQFVKHRREVYETR
ncbi:MAG: type II toxin-antitoxin system RelE/ParE family toxin [Gemmatimonadota bacterium]|nr:type II toxin-antitoxin system RelE/ParE family toxin [Gemmatimonadota bacterium]